MGRKRTHQQEDEPAMAPKRIKTEIPSELSEEYDQTQESHDVSYEKKPKRKDKKKQGSLEEGGDYAEEVKEHHSQKHHPYRRKNRGINLARAAVRERRHVTLPYHLIGGNTLRSCEFIAKMTVGKYRPKVRGVVISIGSVRLASLPRVIDDQNVFHLDIFVTQAVFRPVTGVSYEARVTHIAEDFLSALILESISISIPVDDKFRHKLKGIVLNVDDIIEVKHKCLTIKRGMCQLKGTFKRILRKGTESKGENEDASQLNESLY
ncbi:unnamed protein product [Haemonchus placei]|uniref:S1 motif domain-containing protein n=1 Tax=Haemonchus placei TaxID=6290 RepID=A0A0N4WEQ5_HAEPC|nr:unnamed protein product [Haemonchus placei]